MGFFVAKMYSLMKGPYPDCANLHSKRLKIALKVLRQAQDDTYDVKFAFLAGNEFSSPGRSGIPEVQRKDTAENGNKL